MWIWYALLIFLIVSMLSGGLYLTVAMSRFRLFRRIAGDKLRKRYAVSFVSVLALFAALTFTMNMMNSIIVFLHLVAAFLIFGILFRVATKLRKKEFPFYAQGWSALLSVTVYLAAGWFLCHHVRQTNYTLATEKPIGSLRIALFADSHIGTTFDADGMAHHIDTMMRQAPDLVVIAGDFVDDGTSRRDMLRACEALGKIRPKYGVWFAFGNHDQGYYRNRGFSVTDLVRALEENNVNVLGDKTAEIGPLCLVGRLDVSRSPRKEISELLASAPTDKYIVVIDHEPTDYEEESQTAADLVLSGHTHGGQLFPINRAGEWFGLNDRTYGCEKRSGTEFIVTSGISDWAVKFKTGTQSEYVIIDVKTAR